MDIGSILIAVALVLAVVAFVARPLFERAPQPDNPNTAPLDALIAQRESILIELRDLDFEHSTGKMTDEDYAAQRYRLVTKGAEILRAIDTAPGAAQTPAGAEDEIEQLIAARRKGRAKTAAGSAVAACPRCGQSIEPQDKFCAHCGAKLAAAS